MAPVELGPPGRVNLQCIPNAGPRQLGQGSEQQGSSRSALTSYTCLPVSGMDSSMLHRVSLVTRRYAHDAALSAQADHPPTSANRSVMGPSFALTVVAPANHVAVSISVDSAASLKRQSFAGISTTASGTPQAGMVAVLSLLALDVCGFGFGLLLPAKRLSSGLLSLLFCLCFWVVLQFNSSIGFLFVTGAPIPILSVTVFYIL